MSALKISEAWNEAQTTEKEENTALCHNMIYMYDLPAEFDDEPEARTAGYLGSMDTSVGFGHFYMADVSFVGAVAHRIYKSPCRTKDPSRAHAFLIPLWPLLKKEKEWSSICTNNYSASEFEKSLDVMNSQNIKQHILMHNHGNWDKGKCKGWWSEPSETLSGVSRFTVEESQKNRGVTSLKSTIPYSSQIHYTANGGQLPWVNNFTRSYLATFVGSLRAFKENPASKEIRSAVLSSCAFYTEDCTMLIESSLGKRQFDSRDYFEKYSGAEFCMQPPGDSMVRKGMVDSLLVGCIPVLFDSAQVGVWPWHWDGWRSQSMVYIHENSHHDPISVLKAIPMEEREKMREAIARNAHKMQYASDEPPADMPDAFNIIVDHIKKNETEFDALQAEERLTAQFNMLLRQLEAKKQPEFTKGRTSIYIPDDSNMPIVVGF